jgi:glycosyltransferase involved in cell wall biosynthesis
MDLACNLPLNNLSFGQTSFALIKNLYEKEFKAKIFPIGGNVDLSSQKLDQNLGTWIKNSIDRASLSFSRKEKIFKLWHINGSLESFAERQVLFSFYELDSPTAVELNIVKNNHKVIFSSKYTCDIFKSLGCDNIEHVPLFFDNNNFSVKDKSYSSDDRIVFNLVGKLEKRKNHKKVIQSWLKKYGNNRKYFLQCSIFNPFLKQEDQNALINSMLEGNRYFNISFLGHMQANETYNDYLNSANIILGMSGGEGWGLPEFHSLALGKHAVILNAHTYKDWANDNNSVMVDPSEKIEAYDNMFFTKGSPFNQGNIFSFKEEAFIAGCEQAIKRYESNKINTAGLELQKKYTIDNTVSQILKLME